MRHALAIAALLLALPATAHGQGLALFAAAPDTGYVDLAVTGPEGTMVTISEVRETGTTVVATTTIAGGRADLPRAATWVCDPLERRFVASAPGQADATATVTTPHCRGRLEASIPSRAETGDLVEVSVRDAWRIGDVTVFLCVTPPGGERSCRRRRIAPGESRLQTGFRARRPGRWSAQVKGFFERRSPQRTEVRNPDGRVDVLATGDSMIQIIDSFLVQRLDGRDGVSVRSDAHISTGISKPAFFNWQRHARRQARSRPDAVVMFIGANDGFDMPTRRGRAICCGRDWIAEYARRAGRMMDAYARDGAGRVYWLLLPAPRGGAFARVFRAVNPAIVRAARRRPDDVEIIDLRRTFTPRGRFQRTIRRNGRSLVVRQGDGVHLSVAGASIAASLVAREMRRDGLLR